VRVNELLRARRNAMLDALEQHLPEGAVWSRPEGGYFVWLDLPDVPPDLTAGEAAGVTFVKGEDFFVGGRGGERSLRLAFSFVSPAEISDGVARLARLLVAAATPASTV
jgi:DNA-binding transcriptional MocR family regulator